MRKYNHFFIVGAQRSGTTYLYKILDSHPEINLAKPLRPEPKFFLDADEFKKGYEYYLEKYYPDIDDAVQLLGEKSTSYIESRAAAVSIREWFPKAKIIIILRNPVQRALSNYFFSVENGLEYRSPEEVFIDKKAAPPIPGDISVSPFNYLERGEYTKYVNMYQTMFSSEQMNILIFEKLVGKIRKIMDLYNWLNVNPNFKPRNIYRKVNVSKNKKSVEQPVIDYLYSYYKKEVEGLETYLNISLSEWKR